MKKLIIILLFISFTAHAVEVPTQVMETLKKVFPTQNVKWHKNKQGYEAHFKTKDSFGSAIISQNGELLMKIETIGLDDAPVLVAENLEGHDVKSIIRVTDYVDNFTSYDVKSRLDKHNYTNYYNSAGELEYSRKAPNLLAIPIGVSILLLLALSMSFSG